MRKAKVGALLSDLRIIVHSFLASYKYHPPSRSLYVDVKGDLALHFVNHIRGRALITMPDGNCSENLGLIMAKVEGLDSDSIIS